MDIFVSRDNFDKSNEQKTLSDKIERKEGSDGNQSRYLLS